MSWKKSQKSQDLPHLTKSQKVCCLSLIFIHTNSKVTWKATTEKLELNVVAVRLCLTWPSHAAVRIFLRWCRRRSENFFRPFSVILWLSDKRSETHCASQVGTEKVTQIFQCTPRFSVISDTKKRWCCCMWSWWTSVIVTARNCECEKRSDFRSSNAHHDFLRGRRLRAF